MSNSLLNEKLYSSWIPLSSGPFETWLTSVKYISFPVWPLLPVVFTMRCGLDVISHMFYLVVGIVVKDKCWSLLRFVGMQSSHLCYWRLSSLLRFTLEMDKSLSEKVVGTLTSMKFSLPSRKSSFRKIISVSTLHSSWFSLLCGMSRRGLMKEPESFS